MDWMYKLSENLNTYYRATDISVTVYDPEGSELNTIGPGNSFCAMFQDSCGERCPCAKAHEKALSSARDSASSSVAACPAGYLHFAVPCTIGGKLKACALAGPVAPEYPDPASVDRLVREYALPESLRPRLWVAYAGAPVVEQERARYLCKLLEAVVSGMAGEEENKSADSSDRVGEFIRLLKHEDLSAPEQFAQEQQLISDVISGDKEHARSLLNDMLSGIYFNSGENRELIQSRCVELIALLSRAIIECGGDSAQVYQISESAMRQVMLAGDLTALSYSMLEILDTFLSFAFARYPQQDSTAIRRAVSFINANYTRDVSLQEVAGLVSMNPSYFSTLFKKKMNVSFSDYLSDRRIAKAKLLLRESNLSLSEIARESGYENHSYFSRVFKARTGMTPKQYRHEE